MSKHDYLLRIIEREKRRVMGVNSLLTLEHAQTKIKKRDHEFTLRVEMGMCKDKRLHKNGKSTCNRGCVPGQADRRYSMVSFMSFTRANFTET